MRTMEISTHLEAAPETVREHVLRPSLLEYVARGMIRFKPVEPSAFPDVWRPGRYRTMMYWKGFLPVGSQSIVIEPQPMKGDVWSLRDRGHGALIKLWDHIVEVSPEGSGSRYVDRITVDAGVFTLFIALFASRFYKHRQKRWRRLVSNGFDYSN